MENQWGDNCTDDVLLERLREGDRRAFQTIYQRYWEELLRATYRVFPDRELCMDILQDVFVRLWTHRAFLDVRHLRNYLLTAVKYQIANYLRREKVSDKYLKYRVNETDSYEENGVELKELYGLIMHFAKELPVRCGEVFYLSRICFKTNKEIATELGISEKTVEMHLTTALKRLRIHLDRYAMLLLVM